MQRRIHRFILLDLDRAPREIHFALIIRGFYNIDVNVSRNYAPRRRVILKGQLAILRLN